MRKSSEVQLVLLAAVALSVTSCRQHRDCVDSQNRLLPDSACDVNNGRESYYDSERGYYYGGGAHYVYGGYSGGHMGDTVIGGSVTRGGFGSFGGSHGGSGE